MVVTSTSLSRYTSCRKTYSQLLELTSQEKAPLSRLRYDESDKKIASKLLRVSCFCEIQFAREKKLCAAKLKLQNHQQQIIHQKKFLKHHSGNQPFLFREPPKVLMRATTLDPNKLFPERKIMGL